MLLSEVCNSLVISNRNTEPKEPNTMNANIAGLTKNVESLARFGWVQPGLKAKYLEAVKTFDPTTANKSTVAVINAGADNHALTPVMAGIHTVIGTVAR